MKKGKLIVIEGTDCSGKETQARLLIENLGKNGIKCGYMTFPAYDTPTGKIIGECYLGRNSESFFENPAALDPKIASLYYAADRLASSEKIQNLLNKGVNVICDRYVESNLGHQGSKVKGEKRGEIIEFIRDLEYGLLKLPKPDMIIFLYMPYAIGIELKKGRSGKADAHESNESHLKNAQECYLQLCDKYGWKKVDCSLNNNIETLKTREEISKEVYKYALGAINFK